MTKQDRAQEHAHAVRERHAAVPSLTLSAFGTTNALGVCAPPIERRADDVGVEVVGLGIAFRSDERP